MKFIVDFKSERDGKPYVLFDMPRRPMGIKDLDRIREDLEVEELPAEKIEEYVPQFSGSFYRIIIDEETARESGLFNEKNIRTIYVHPNGGLNGFIKEKVFCKKDQKTGEILYAGIKKFLDDEEIIDNWKRRGFPQIWENAQPSVF